MFSGGRAIIVTIVVAIIAVVDLFGERLTEAGNATGMPGSALLGIRPGSAFQCMAALGYGGI